MSRYPADTRRFGEIGAFAKDLVTFAGRRVAPAVLLVAAGSLLEGIGLLLLVPLLGVVLRGATGDGALSKLSHAVLSRLPSETPTGRLAFLLLGFALLLVIRGLVLIRRDTLLTQLQVNFVNSRRQRIVELLACSRWSTITRLRHGRISHVLGTDVYNLRTTAHFLVQISVSFVLICFQCFLVFLISPLLSLFITILLGVAYLSTRHLLARARRLGSEVTESNLAIANSTAEFLNSLKISLSQSLEGSFLEAFRIGSANAATREVSFARQRGVSQAMLTGCAAATVSLVLLLNIAWLHSPIPVLILGIVLIARMTTPAMQIQQGVQQISHTIPAYSQLKELERELSLGGDPVALLSHRPARMETPQMIELDYVSFAHDPDGDERGGIADLSLQICPRTFLGVTGPSGAGKTTFVDLVVGLFAPQTGTILVGSKVLEGDCLRAWRESISYISQDPFLYHTSIRDNLLWADSTASEGDILRALMIAGAYELVQQLPAGLETVVGERGCLLSGGERQRIALARALVRKPILLVLDEATNAIDTAGEARILERLTQLENRPTIVIVAHRPSSLAYCDEIIELADGRLSRDSKRARGSDLVVGRQYQA